MESTQSYRHQLREIEVRTLDGLDLVAVQLTRTLDAVTDQSVELAAMVIAASRQLERRYVDLHGAVLALMARQAPVADDIRLIAAVIHTSRCIERIGDQCATIAKLVPLSGYETPSDEQTLDTLVRMGQLAHSQIRQVHEALKTRHVSLARAIARHDLEINQLNREVFQRSLEISDDPEIREWSMFMVLVARCLERIGDNTVEIADQVIFVVTGRLHQATAASP